MNEYIPPRSCGDCTGCCQGHLSGESYGHKFYPGRPCFYLKKVCSIYEYRPDGCKNYYCAWVQGLFSEQLNPILSKIIVSVEFDENNKQFLKVVPMTNDPVSQEVITELEEFVTKNQTYYKVIYNA